VSSLESLVRVHQWILDEKRQSLLGLQQLFDRMGGDLEVLEEKLAAEREAASRTLDGALAFQTIIPAIQDRRDKLRHSIANLEQEIETAQYEVGEAFQELRKFVSAQEMQQRQETERRRRHEQVPFDESGIGLYRRNRAVGDSS
jgi:flagellar export protein FliJ